MYFVFLTLVVSPYHLVSGPIEGETMKLSYSGGASNLEKTRVS